MDPFEYGDPYVNWNEENSARENADMSDFNVEDLKSKVVNELVAKHDFEIDEAEESVRDSVKDSEHLWNENADPIELAKFLASDEIDD